MFGERLISYLLLEDDHLTGSVAVGVAWMMMLTHGNDADAWRV